MSWEGPHKIGDYLGSVVRSSRKRPPEKRAGVYIITENPWRDVPTKEDRVLYVGQATYLRYQIGRLLCDLLGFTGDFEEAYQHSGGHTLWSNYCLPHQLEPADLYLAWCAEYMCLACAENKLLEMMSGGPRRGNVCPIHNPILDLAQNGGGLIQTTLNSGIHHR